MLRSFVIRTLLTTLCLGAASRALATELLYEGFNYTLAQPLSSQTHPNGSQWLHPLNPSGSGSAQQTIIAGDISYPGALATATSTSLSVPRATAAPNGSNTENRIDIPGRPYTRAAGAVDGAPSLYFSFTMKMTSWTNFAAPPTTNPSDTKNDAAAKNAANRKGGNIAGFHGGPASESTSMQTAGGFAAPVLIRREIDYSVNGTDGTPGTQTGFYEIGMLKQFNTPVDGVGNTDFATLDAAFDTDLHFGVGDTVLVVGEYDFVDTALNGTGDIARLWINPTPGNVSLEATPSVTVPANALNLQGSLNIESFHVKGDTITPGGFSLDSIRVGNTFADVNPAAPPVTGDYNGNGVVDAADYALWRKGGPLQNDPLGPPIGPAQYDQWRANFGNSGAGAGSSLQADPVPEPGTLLGLLLVMAMTACCVRQNRR